MGLEFKEAYDVISKGLRDDKALYYSYQANLAMAFKDECARMGYKFPDLHIIANEAAKNFLDLWIRRTENASN